MKWTVRIELPLLVLVALNLALGLAVWRVAPAQVPVHWNLAGQVDDWGPKAFGLLVAPAFAAVVYVLLTPHSPGGWGG